MDHPVGPRHPHHPSGGGEVPDRNTSQAPSPSPYEQRGQPHPPPPPEYAPGSFAPPASSQGFQGAVQPQPSTGQPGQQDRRPGPGSPPPSPPGQRIPGAVPVPAYDPAAPPPTRRGVDSPTITTLLLNVPHFLGSLLVIWVISQIFPTWLGIFLGLVWLASGALMFHRPTERVVAKLLYKVRRPTGAELAKLQPLWDEVARRAGLDGSRYDLWIEDSDEVNAFGAAGHIVGVTRHSLHRLPPDQLSAVLAHELGHHINGHAWSGLLGVYYSLPARIVMVTVKYVVIFAVVLVAEFAILGAVIVVLLIGIFAIAVAFTFPPALALLAIPLLRPWASRRGELRADRFAGEIGYGPLLIAVFTDHLNQGADTEEEEGALARVMSTHPPLPTRILALETFAAGPPGSRPS